MKAKYGKRNEDKKTDVEILHSLQLISKMQKIDVLRENVEREHEARVHPPHICVRCSHSHSIFEIAL